MVDLHDSIDPYRLMRMSHFLPSADAIRGEQGGFFLVNKEIQYGTDCDATKQVVAVLFILVDINWIRWLVH